MEGPSQAKIECDDKGDGSCDVCYWPTEPGEYAVHVLCKNEDIQHSPFMVEIVPPPAKDFYPDKVGTQEATCLLHSVVAAVRKSAVFFKLDFALCKRSGEGARPGPSEQRPGRWKAHRVHS